MRDGLVGLEPLPVTVWFLVRLRPALHTALLRLPANGAQGHPKACAKCQLGTLFRIAEQTESGRLDLTEPPDLRCPDTSIGVGIKFERFRGASLRAQSGAADLAPTIAIGAFVWKILSYRRVSACRVESPAPPLGQSSN
jgi:hypothetical protein